MTAPDKSIVIEPNGAKAVQIVFDMHIKGKTQAEICGYLNDLGFRTAQGKPFGKNSVNKIIKNKRYIGVYTYDDILADDGLGNTMAVDRLAGRKARVSRVHTTSEGNSALLVKFLDALAVMPRETDDSNRYAWLDQIESEEVSKVLRKLSQQQIEILTLVAFEGYNATEAGKILGLTQQGVSWHIDKIKKILKNFKFDF